MLRCMLEIFLALVLALGCTSGTSEDSGKQASQPKAGAHQGGTYRAALPWSPKSLDPAVATDIYAVTIIEQVFDGLVQFDQHLNVVPALAKDWQVTADGRTYIFQLRRGVKFHNGRQVTASDVVYSLRRLLDPDMKASVVNFLTKISGAAEYRSGRANAVRGLEATGEYTLRIRLQEPFAPFLSVLAMKDCKVVPKEEVESAGRQFSRHPVGTGPFRFESWSGNKIILAANNSYYEGPPYLDRLVYNIYPGAKYEQIFADFKAGRLEEAAVFGSHREEAVKGRAFQFYRKPTLSLQFYGLNCSKGPLKDRRVRQALNFAIDKRRIVREVYGDQFIPAGTILPPGMPGYTPDNSMYDYQPTEAKRLLQEAGFSPEGRRLELSLLSASKSAAAQKELALIAADLEAVGVDLQITYETDWPTYEKLLRSENVEVYRYAWFADLPDPDNFLNILCGSASAYNFMRYHNARVDQLLSQGLTETNVLERMQVYRLAERSILDDAPMIPWIYLTFESVFQPYVKGLEISALGGPYIPLKRVWLDR
ncbi:MAG: ABC transporter substrate-binding protein [Deltaproteobacteria bacterium]|nr:ABC transporter substrate-binding protein [Deltaproteobacteria bacterium]MBW2073001.1 ABC transporter substrate-binding protein [Deltaproteobacteria bacterium]